MKYLRTCSDELWFTGELERQLASKRVEVSRISNDLSSCDKSRNNVSSDLDKKMDEVKRLRDCVEKKVRLLLKQTRKMRYLLKWWIRDVMRKFVKNYMYSARSRGRIAFPIVRDEEILMLTLKLVFRSECLSSPSYKKNLKCND